MPGRLDEEDKKEIESQAKEAQKKGLSARLEAASDKGKMDDEAMRRAWDAKKGGGAEGGAGRSAGSAQPKDAQAEEESEKKKRERDAAAEKEKEQKRVNGEHQRNHDLYWQKQQERGR